MSSNRGKSALKPTRNERDSLVQCWVNRKDLATIGLYMESKGVKIHHMADILTFSIETVRSIVLKANGTYVDSTEKATAYLSDRFKVNLNPGGRGQKNLITNLLLESGVTDDDIAPVVPSPTLSVADVAALKQKAREEFALGAGKDLLSSREEKDSAATEASRQAFLEIAGRKRKEGTDD